MTEPCGATGVGPGAERHQRRTAPQELSERRGHRARHRDEQRRAGACERKLLFRYAAIHGSRSGTTRRTYSSHSRKSRLDGSRLIWSSSDVPSGSGVAVSSSAAFAAAEAAPLLLCISLVDIFTGSFFLCVAFVTYCVDSCPSFLDRCPPGGRTPLDEVERELQPPRVLVGG